MSNLLAELGRFSARHRLVVIAAWLLLFVTLTTVVATSPQKDSTDGGGMPDTAAARALNVLHDKFPAMSGSAGSKQLQLVIQTKGTAKATDPATAATISQLLGEARRLPQVSTVSNPFDPAHPRISADRTTVVSTLSFHDLTDANQEAVYTDVLHLADTARSQFTAEVGGELFAPAVPKFGAGELLGVVFAFVVLLLTFGSLVAAGANLLVAIFGVGVGTLGVLAYGAVNPIQSTTITLTTMLGLAVGIDYSLFILSRFRAELRAGQPIESAVARATGTAGTAVVFAGLTVIIALTGLSVVGISFIRDMGLAGAFGVLIAVLMALTLLPVLLRTIGHRALSRRERRAAIGLVPDKRQRPSALTKWASLIVRRPVPVAAAAVVLIALLAVPMLSMRTASSIPGGNDPSSTERRAYDLVVKEFGGVQSPLLVLATGQDLSDRLPAIRSELRTLPDVKDISVGAVTPQDDAAVVTVVPNGSPIDDRTKTLVTDIRDRADRIADVHLEVTGETAIGIDNDARLHSALMEYLVVIVVMSFLLLMVLFRSLLVPLIATLGYLLSLAAAFGVTVAVFQWGWFGGLMSAPTGDPMLSMLPVILVGVLFGLAMDYQVFLGSRIQECYRADQSPAEAVSSGFRRAAPVVVAAAVIMAFVFAGFASSPMTVAASIALGLVAGVVVDALLVRLVIMPAMLSLLGGAAWWLPKWLDRILPRVDTEGHAFDSATTSEAHGIRFAVPARTADEIS